MCILAQNQIKHYLISNQKEKMNNLKLQNDKYNKDNININNISASPPEAENGEEEEEDEELMAEFNSEAVECLTSLTEKVKIVKLTDVNDLKKWVDNEMEIQIIDNQISLMVIDSIDSS